MDKKKLKAKLDRAVKSMNEVVAEVQKEHQDAFIYITGNVAQVCIDRNTDDCRDQEDIILFDSIAFENMDCGGW